MQENSAEKMSKAIGNMTMVGQSGTIMGNSVDNYPIANSYDDQSL